MKCPQCGNELSWLPPPEPTWICNREMCLYTEEVYDEKDVKEWRVCGNPEMAGPPFRAWERSER